MKNNKVLLLILISFLIMSCSQNDKKTSAKLKLNLSGIAGVTTSIGSGGVLLFGKSATGEQFGKLVNGPELEMDLPNGDWSFYAVMWENNYGSNLNDTVYCGKSVQVLNGAAVSVGLNLTNAQCADTDFSTGNHYVGGNSKIRFPDLYIEECDDLAQAFGFACKQENQGSALSYRMAFKSYTKAANGTPVFSNEVLHSQCMAAEGTNSVMQNGMKVNFPTAMRAMPFIISTEMFLGSTDCNSSGSLDKGMYTHTFTNGIAAQSTLINKVVTPAAALCMVGPANKVDCESLLGVWSAGNLTCSVTTPMTAAFIPAAYCGGAMVATTARYLKQMIAIPKDFLCRNVNTGLFGANVFPGGQGTPHRPYKICDEWQLNQIGDKYTTSSLLNTKSFKLMNDLDMNKADFNPLLRPSCIDPNDSDNIYKRHHNLNPLDQVTLGGCTLSHVKTNEGYTGVFNGNNKTISHARIYVGTDKVGFVRKLGQSGVIKNLNFQNLEVEGSSYVGGVAGIINGSFALVSNVNIRGGSIEAEYNVIGGVTGEVVNAANTITSVRVENVDLYAHSKIGGLVAINDGVIEKSMFRGKIRHHISADDNVGGLVAEAKTASVIRNSFSEGQIESSAKWIGGIAGINAGVIKDSYSTMYILSKFQGSSAFVGGITGGNENGTIVGVYTHGGYVYEGGNPYYTIDSITASGNIATNCVISTGGNTTSACEGTSNLRTGSTILSSMPSSSEWAANIGGSLPRLKWEAITNSRACLLPENLLPIANQTGRGTASNPFIICSPDQLKSLSGKNAGTYAALAEDINIKAWPLGDLITTFGGELNGLGHSIYGLNMYQASYAGNLGIFLNNTGKILNLNIVGNKVVNLNGMNPTGVLAGVNSGTILNVSFFNNKVEGLSYVGVVAGANSGFINDINISEGSVAGGMYVGGVAGQNNGSILRSSVNTKISNTGISNYNKFGGITGMNMTSGFVDQVVYSGQMNFQTSSESSIPYIGGIIGYNDGNLSNAMTKKYSTINVKNSMTVGGLVGFNAANSSIKKSLSFGRVIYTSGIIPTGSTFSQIAGSNSGNIEENSTFLLENNTAGFLGAPQVVSCSGNFANFGVYPSGPEYLTDLAATMGNNANLLTVDMTSVNANNETGLTPFTTLSDYTISIAGCIVGEKFYFYRGYEPALYAKKSANELGEAATFANFSMAYEAEGAYGLKVNELIAFYKARMYKTAMPEGMIAPIWVFEDYKGPRLLQVND